MNVIEISKIKYYTYCRIGKDDEKSKIQEKEQISGDKCSRKLSERSTS